MIFKETYQQVLDGTKAQTRRPVKPLEWPLHVGKEAWDKGTITHVSHRGRTKWQVGKDYAVQPGRGKKAVGRIRITKIRRERLQEIRPDGLRAEGLQKDISDVWGSWRDRWVALWNSLYRKPYRWKDNPEVWVLEFEYIGT